MSEAGYRRAVPRRQTAALLALFLLPLAGCSGHTGGFGIDAICATSDAPITTVADLNAIRDRIIKAAPKKLGDKPAGKPFEKFKAGIAFGTAAALAAAPYAVPERLQPEDLPKMPVTTEVRKAQQALAKACG